MTTAGASVWNLLGCGVVRFAVFGIALVGLAALPHLFPLPPTAALLLPFRDHAWNAEFWLFLAVASFGFQPVVEELFYRGYCQTRLAEAFGDARAIIIVALFHAWGTISIIISPRLPQRKLERSFC